MGKETRIIFNLLATALLFTSYTGWANSSVLDEAVQTYYSGRPAEAISMLTPLAESGDVKAQYMLGNIFYSLATTNKLIPQEESIKWYQMASDQDFAEANSALGVIYYNQWIKSRQEKDAAFAISYFEKALEQGARVAQKPLENLKSFSGLDASAVMALVQASLKETKAVIKEERVEMVSVPIVEQLPVEPEPEKMVQRPAPKPEVVSEVIQPEEPAKSESISDKANAESALNNNSVEESALTVEFDEIIHQCTQYTEIGFEIYADTIRSASVVGEAKVSKIEPVSSALAFFDIGIETTKDDISIHLLLNDVPKSLAWDVQQGDIFSISGNIGSAQLKGSNCNIRASYKASES